MGKMKHWTVESVFWEPEASETIRDATAAIIAEFEAITTNGYPRIVSVSSGGDDDDAGFQHAFVVELAPGVVMPIECGLLESVREGWGDPLDVGDIVDLTMEDVLACMPRVDQLSDAIHSARVTVRRIIGGWASEGIQARLIDVTLARYAVWQELDDPKLVFVVEGLDHLLRPTAQEINLHASSPLTVDLEFFKSYLSRQLCKRADLAKHGASGSIDQLALNAIAHFGDVETSLRRFEAEQIFWLPDDTAISMRDGEVTAGNGGMSPSLLIGHRSVTIDNVSLPETTLVAAIGRPITAIVEHHFLSENMIVTEGFSAVEDDRPSVTLHFDMPQWLFCSTTGRIWQ